MLACEGPATYFTVTCHCVANLSASLPPSQCADPYTRGNGGPGGPGGTCALDTDGDGIADYRDKCPYQFGEYCTTLTPLPPSLPRCTGGTDTTWELSWRDAAHGATLYTRCPGGVDVSAGIVQTYLHIVCGYSTHFTPPTHAVLLVHELYSSYTT